MFKKIAAVATLILASSAAFAAQPGTVYAGADVGKTKVDEFKRDTSVGAFVGYNFHQNFALEAGFRRLADYEFHMGGHTMDVKVNQLALSVIGSLPVGESFSVYGRLGANRIEARSRFLGLKIKESTNSALYGVGVSYAFTPAVSARVEVQKPSSDSTNLSAGVAFQF